MILRNTHVMSLLEYAKNKVLIATSSSGNTSSQEIVHLNNFRFVQIYRGLTFETGKNIHMSCLPNFNVDNFPFVICSDSKNINLVNVSCDYIKPLIRNKSACTQAQLPFFVKKEFFGFGLHFTRLSNQPNSITKLEWHHWRLTNDFIKTLTDFGRLPESKTKKILKMEKHNDLLKRQVDKLVR